jgi:hypothetical protein
MTDSLEAIREDVAEESGEELLGRYTGFLDAVAVTAISPGKTNATIVARHQTVIGDGNTVRITAEVVRQFSRSGKGWF